VPSPQTRNLESRDCAGFANISQRQAPSGSESRSQRRHHHRRLRASPNAIEQTIRALRARYPNLAYGSCSNRAPTPCAATCFRTRWPQSRARRPSRRRGHLLSPKRSPRRTPRPALRDRRDSEARQAGAHSRRRRRHRRHHRSRTPPRDVVAHSLQWRIRRYYEKLPHACARSRATLGVRARCSHLLMLCFGPRRCLSRRFWGPLDYDKDINFFVRMCMSR